MDELQQLLDLLMGRPGIIAATSASIAALYKIWQIVIDRKNEQIDQKEVEESTDKDLVKTLMSVIEKTLQNGSGKRTNDLLEHEQSFRSSLLETITRLQMENRRLEEEKRQLRDQVMELTSRLMNTRFHS